MFLIAILSMVLINCSSDDNNSQADFEPVNIEFTLIGWDALLNGYENIPQQNIVIYDEPTWQDLIDLIDSTQPFYNVSDGFSTTDIDFENFQLIVVIDEVRLTISEITITSVVENQDNIVVTYGFSSSPLQVESKPFHIVQIPKSDKPVVFEVE